MIVGKTTPCQWISNDGKATPADFWEVAHAAISQFNSLVNKYPVRVVADSYFSNKSFIKELADNDKPIYVITKLKSNAVAYEDPVIPSVKKRGRPIKKGNHIKFLGLIN